MSLDDIARKIIQIHEHNLCYTFREADAQILVICIHGKLDVENGHLPHHYPHPLLSDEEIGLLDLCL
jgi:hypothetical protein